MTSSLLPLHSDLSRCLGHPYAYKGRGTPTEWCPLRATCARHQTIAADPADSASAVRFRLCSEHEFDEHLPLGAAA